MCSGALTTCMSCMPRINTCRVFILEPQPWKSYRKARGTTATIDGHYSTIELRPSDFTEYLKSDEGGFARVEPLGRAVAGSAQFASSKGTERSIVACFKAGAP
jgi:hypothetical protein